MKGHPENTGWNQKQISFIVFSGSPISDQKPTDRGKIKWWILPLTSGFYELLMNYCLNPEIFLYSG